MSVTKVTDDLIDDVAASKITGALPAISGASLTSLNASNLGSGTVPTARLGSGTASSSTFLRGDSTYAAAGGGKVGQVIMGSLTVAYSRTSMTSTYVSIGLAATITCAATSSKVLVICNASAKCSGSHNNINLAIHRGSTLVGGKKTVTIGDGYGYLINNSLTYLDSPSSDAAITYSLMSADDGNDGGNVYVNKSNSTTTEDNTNESHIILIEILA
jgi:hypothetical protein